MATVVTRPSSSARMNRLNDTFSGPGDEIKRKLATNAAPTAIVSNRTRLGTDGRWSDSLLWFSPITPSSHHGAVRRGYNFAVPTARTMSL
jgi:hypothetical protein